MPISLSSTGEAGRAYPELGPYIRNYPPGTVGFSAIKYEGTVPNGCLIQVNTGGATCQAPRITFTAPDGSTASIGLSSALTIASHTTLSIDTVARTITTKADSATSVINVAQYLEAPVQWPQLRPGINRLAGTGAEARKGYNQVDFTSSSVAADATMNCLLPSRPLYSATLTFMGRRRTDHGVRECNIYGRLTVLQADIENPSGRKARAALVRCACGTVYVVDFAKLADGRLYLLRLLEPRPGEAHQARLRRARARDALVPDDGALLQPEDASVQGLGRSRRSWSVTEVARHQHLLRVGRSEPRTLGLWSATLDRINNDGNYEPGNVRWADWETQRRNQRRYLNGDHDE